LSTRDAGVDPVLALPIPRAPQMEVAGQVGVSERASLIFFAAIQPVAALLFRLLTLLPIGMGGQKVQQKPSRHALIYAYVRCPRRNEEQRTNGGLHEN
jgi:hypothetical protein